MLSNRIAVAVILVSLFPLGASLYSVFFSGTTVQTFPINSREGTTPGVTVNTDMNPLRMLLHMDYSTGFNNSGNNEIKYDVTAYETSGKQLWTNSGYIMDKQSNSASSTSTHKSLQTFDTNQNVELEFEYHIKINKLSDLNFSGELELKRNVTPHSWLITAPGLLLLIAGILIVAINQKKKS